MTNNVLERAEKILHGKLEDVIGKFEKNQAELQPRNPIDETSIPIAPRILWLDARENFTLGHYIGSVLPAGMAVEIAIREVMQDWFETRVTDKEAKSAIASLLEDFDFRKAISICESFQILGDKKTEKVYGKLQQCYNIRNKYSHAKLTEILGKLGREPVEVRDAQGQLIRTETIADDDFMAIVAARGLKAHDDALEIIKLVRESFDSMFPKPHQ